MKNKALINHLALRQLLFFSRNYSVETEEPDVENQAGASSPSRVSPHTPPPFHLLHPVLRSRSQIIVVEPEPECSAKFRSLYFIKLGLACLRREVSGVGAAYKFLPGARAA
jgi:hypothetical protein